MRYTNVRSRAQLQLQFPVLADQTLAEAVVRFFLYQPKPFALVDATRRVQNVIVLTRNPGRFDAVCDAQFENGVG